MQKLVVEEIHIPWHHVTHLLTNRPPTSGPRAHTQLHLQENRSLVTEIFPFASSRICAQTCKDFMNENIISKRSFDTNVGVYECEASWSAIRLIVTFGTARR